MAKEHALADGRENLRGEEVIVTIDGEPRWFMIVTHIRGDRWLGETRRGRRLIVRETEMTFIE